VASDYEVKRIVEVAVNNIIGNLVLGISYYGVGGCDGAGCDCHGESCIRHYFIRC
jgi:hypothetical protein